MSVTVVEGMDKIKKSGLFEMRGEIRVTVD